MDPTETPFAQDAEQMGSDTGFAAMAGHFVKTIYNVIECCTMTAYAEGFNLLKNAGASIYQRGDGAETIRCAPQTLTRTRSTSVRSSKYGTGAVWWRLGA